MLRKYRVITSQWNHAVNDEGDEVGSTGSYNDKAMKVVFDVSVEAVTPEKAEELAKDNKDISVNFMALVNEDFSGFKYGASSSVPEGGNSGYYLISQLNNRGSTSAAHEFGHLLGYNSPKSGPFIKEDDENHANRSTEGNFIMARPLKNEDQNTQRRVNYAEAGRLNSGQGLGVTSTSLKLPNGKYVYYHPNPLTNKIFKQ